MERKCEGCTACCYLVGVEELQKPLNTACTHCEQGCKLFGQPDRPKSCTGFQCLWLQELAPEEMKPDKVHVVFDVTQDGKTIIAHSDVRHGEPWRSPLVWDFIRDLVWKLKIDVLLVEGMKQRLLSVNSTAFEISPPLGKKLVD